MACSGISERGGDHLRGLRQLDHLCDNRGHMKERGVRQLDHLCDNGGHMKQRGVNLSLGYLRGFCALKLIFSISFF